jgi:Skp family chaperone for outer membrane proteins
MKTTFLLAAAAFVPGLFLIQASGGSSVVVIDFERAISETPGGKDALTKINAYQNEQLTAIDKKQKEAQDLENRLRAGERTLNADTRAQLARDLESTRNSIQSIGEEAQKKVLQMEQELLLPVEQKTRMAINAYAAEHSVKIVLDAATLQTGLVYVHDTADITTEIIRRIAADLQTPGPKHAELDTLPHPLLDRTWLKYSLAGNRSPSLNGD